MKVKKQFAIQKLFLLNLIVQNVWYFKISKMTGFQPRTDFSIAKFYFSQKIY